MVDNLSEKPKKVNQELYKENVEILCFGKNNLEMNNHPLINKLLLCPIDRGNVVIDSNKIFCKSCQAKFLKVNFDLKQIIDFRCAEECSKVKLEFQIPKSFLNSQQLTKFGNATNAKFECMSREEIRKKFKTKLQKEILYYIQQLKRELGFNIEILDLGCGSGGNRLFLNSIGFKNVLSVDYWSSEADILVDAHRLPFKDASFDFILTTATIEHFYNPFVAFSEISRVLKPGGSLVASGSFWESWHDQSCFHFTPNGLFLLCDSAGLTLEDLWSGWGFIPSVSSHALGLRRFKKYTYMLQELFDLFLSKCWSKEFASKHRLKTSGSFGIYARKIYESC